jgi:Bifunctional DNA primase/polymerase, N-terminal
MISAATNLDAALAYAAHGLPVFPLVPRSKRPATRRGFYDATTNPQTIRRFWKIDDRNVAIPTGEISGFWVLDIDGDDGEASIRRLEAQHESLPRTREVITSRGRHLHFAYTGPIQSSVGRIAPGVDVRCDGAFAIVPPSVHATGRAYQWSVDSADELASAPAWLLELARKKPAPSISERAVAQMQARRVAAPGAYGQAALDDECAVLAGTAPGGRNHALNRAAFALFQLVAGGELDRDHVVERLIEACHRNGLIKDDGLRSVMATIGSGYRAGIQQPRSRPGAP